MKYRLDSDLLEASRATATRRRTELLAVILSIQLNYILLYIERYKTLSPKIGALPEAVTECERSVQEKMAVDLVSKLIPFILGNTGDDTSVLLGVKMSTPRQPYC